jgi:hypothetical protein
MCCNYSSISVFLESKKSVVDKISAINALIDSMIATMADHASGAGANIEEYSLDDGQVKIKTVYRSLADVQSGVASLEKMKQIYINRYNGRNIILRDGGTFGR